MVIISMPIKHTNKGWYWGSKGPFPTKAKALQVGRAAYASGYKEQIMNKSVIGEFVGILLHSATITHIMHFQTQGEGSYATHKALSKYYESIVNLTDGLVEIIQGCYGEIISDYPNMYSLSQDKPLDYMTTLKEYVAEKRQEMPQESNIQNEIDNIANLIDVTCYKLKFLR
jgi:DNA-binding ferritin-like protein